MPLRQIHRLKRRTLNQSISITHHIDRMTRSFTKVHSQKLIVSEILLSALSNGYFIVGLRLSNFEMLMKY